MSGPGVLTKSLLKHGARHVIAIENEVAYTVALEVSKTGLTCC
jgi:16S rRNA A1518/A1519 N6-dimethyltransferase RsmA/KsgA/DIM1 with predicted DNA glycosylase/AP lyase activity